jgi:hypothetical protein
VSTLTLAYTLEETLCVTKNDLFLTEYPCDAHIGFPSASSQVRCLLSSLFVERSPYSSSTLIVEPKKVLNIICDSDLIALRVVRL